MFKKVTIAIFILCLTIGSPAVFASDSTSTTNIKSFTTNSLIKNDGSLWVWGGNKSVPTQYVDVTNVDKQVGEFIMLQDQSVLFLPESNFIYSSSAKAVPVTGINHVTAYAIEYDTGITIIAADQAGMVYKANTTRDAAEISFSKITDIEDVTAITDYFEADDVAPRRSGLAVILLKGDGTVWKMSKFSDTIQQIQGLDKVVQIQDQYALKDDGTVWTWQDTIQSETKAVQVNGIGDIKRLLPARYGFLAIDQQDQLWFNGSTITGYSDMTQYHLQTKPIQFTHISNVRDAAVVERSLLVLTNDQELHSTSIEMEAMPDSANFVFLASQIKEMKAASRHALVQRTNGTLWGWGVNKNADIGNGDYEFIHSSLVPVQQAIAVQLNGETIVLTNGVVTHDNQSYVPLRSIFEKLGAVVTWDNNTKLATITRQEGDQVTVQIKINTKEETIELNNRQVSNKPFSINGTSYLPLRFISESLGAKVDWNQQAEIISITIQ